VFDNILLESIIRNSVENLLNSAYAASWPTKKYSISRTTELSLLVDDATISYALLKACNSGVVTSNDLIKKIVILGNELFEKSEQEFDNDYGCYKVRRGIEYTYDGVVLPFNQQNAFGLVLLELYASTGDNRYRERATELAVSFKSEFEYTDNDRLICHYCPRVFYHGWTNNDNISNNMPNKAIQVDVLYEDMSHAAWNIAFILRFMEVFKNNDIFVYQDIIALKKTLEGTRYGIEYSRFMSGDVVYQQPQIRFRPYFAWTKLNDVFLKEQYARGVPFYYPFFDSPSFIGLAYLVAGEVKN
jgi:hypothetical protein